MDDDWDLHAVVRGCCATTTTSSSSSSSSTPTPTTTTTITTTTTRSSSSGFHSLVSTFQPQQEDKLFCFQDLLFEPRNDSTTTTTIAELHDLFKPFYPKPSPPQPQQPPPPPPPPPPPQPLSPLSVLGGFQDLSQQQVQQNQHQAQLQQQLLLQTQLHQPKQLPTSSGVKRSSNPGGSNGVTTHTQSPRSKRRKNQMKKVCQVPAEGLSSDMWSWRKYGQKPIKGSPYPRGYYRCSTSKGCLARKQVERNKSDPNMFIVTYTGEHNHPMPTHRNSLAGSTRQKPATSGDAEKPNPSPPASPAANLSPAPEKLESSREEKEGTIEEDDDDFSISDMPLDDDFFVGLGDVLTGPGLAHNECFADHFPTTTQFPWLSNNVTTTAADG